MLVTGLFCAGFAVPSTVSAYVDGRAPRVAAILGIVAAILVFAAMNARPGGYTWAQVPDAVVRVVAGVVN